MKTILITGCSSGFGLEIARAFLARPDWTVIATMRTPRTDVLPESERLRLLPLDVTDADSIRRVVETAGPVDVLVNNAGIGYIDALEGTSMATVREIFETNVFGTMAMIQAIVPQMRERRSGVIINISSSVTLMPLPLLSIYTATKAAVNAFSEVFALELEPFDVRVRVVLPGQAPGTSFGANARSRMTGGFPEPYAEQGQALFARFAAGGPVTHASDVVDAVWRAATDASTPMRLAAGADAVALMPA